MKTLISQFVVLALLAMCSVVMVGCPPSSQNQYIRTGDRFDGFEWDSIQDVVDSLPDYSSVGIFLGEGDYDGFRSSEVSVTIFGLGADKTRIVDYDPNHPNVIKFWDATLQLHDLTVFNGAGKRNRYYNDAAILVEFVDKFVMENCIVVNESNVCVVTNYADSVSINHCTIVGDWTSVPVEIDGDWVATDGGWAYGVATYNGQNNAVRNSILTDLRIVFYSNNEVITTGHNSVFLYDELNAGTQYVYDHSRVTSDPLLTDDFHLEPESPCIGAADDGLDIGVDWTRAVIN